MTQKLLDQQSAPLPELATECLTSPGHAIKPRAPSESSILLVGDQPRIDPDATLQVRPCGPKLATARGVNILQRVAGYEILEELGRGGMGVVYKAWQTSLQRTVALKMILAGSFASEQDLERFRAEAMAIARLHHPHLLSIYEIGENTHLPFYAMEYMEGSSLARRLNGEPLAPRTAAELVRTLAEAMDYAHQNGIVHRDLKPANILLSAGPATPLQNCIAKITDFGIAKLLHQDLNHTKTGDILGTPHYMAPEQASGRSGQVGPTADVYSLGAILYELLTGRPPFHGHDGAAVLVLLTREDPEHLSRCGIALPRDLETICMKCLEKDPVRRYASASALADDLQRFLENLPIQAKPASAVDRAIKWTRRRPTLAVSTAMAMSAVVMAFVLMAMMCGQAVNHADKRDELLTESKTMLADAYLDRGIHLAEKGDVRRGMHWMLRSLEMTNEIGLKNGKASALEPIIRMNLASWGQCVSSREMALPHTDWVWDLAFSPDQQFVVTGSKDKRVQAWSMQTGKPIGPALDHPHAVWGTAFHPDGKTFFTLCGDYKDGKAGQLSVWTLNVDKPGHFLPRGTTFALPYSLTRMHLNPQGDRVWISSMDGKATLLAFDAKEAGNGLRVIETPADENHQFAGFSPDGARLATIVGTGLPKSPYFQPSTKIQLWDARTGVKLDGTLEHPGPIRTALFDRDGKQLVVGSSTRTSLEDGESSVLSVWDVAARKRVTLSSPLQGRIKAAALSANGQMLAVSVFEYTRAKEAGRIQVVDGKVGLWQLHADGTLDPHGAALRTGHVVWHMEFSPDGRMLLAGCENSGAFLWSVSNGQQLMPPIWHEGNCVKVAFSKDGRSALTASAGGGTSVSGRLWEVPTFAHIGPPLSQPVGIRGTYWEKDGSHVWIGCGRAHIRWDPFTGSKVNEVAMPNFAFFIHPTNDDQRVLVDFGDQPLREFNSDTRTVTPLPEKLFRSERGYRYDYHAKNDIYVQRWNKPCKFQILDSDGNPLTPLVAEPEYEIAACGLSPDADIIAVAQTIDMRSNRVMIYDARDLRVLHEIPLQHPIYTLAFSPDGKTLAFGGKDRQIQRVDLASGKFIGSPLLHEGIVHWASYLGNDRLLATSTERSMIQVWDAPTGKRIGPAFEHRTDLSSIAVHPHGEYILTASTGKMAMTWRVPDSLDGSLDSVRAWVEKMTGMEMNGRDSILPIHANR